MTHPDRPLVSCLMVTKNRPALARRAIDCFAAQDYEPRELVLVSDGEEGFESCRAYAAERCGARLVTACVPGGSLSLGALRNRSIDLARGDVICQWDDDDLSHPRRISMQLDVMQRQGAGACFLTDQLQLIERTKSLYWCDWANARGIRPPLPTIPNTLLCRREYAPRYVEVGPTSRRSEDAQFMRALHRRATIAQVSCAGWLYVYVSHGANTWQEPHHLAIIGSTGLSAEALIARRHDLRRALAAFPLADTWVVRDHAGAAVFTVGEESMPAVERAAGGV